MPFPYVDADTIDREVSQTPVELGFAEEDWQTLLTDKAEQETARVEGWTDVNYRAEDADVPFVIRAAVIRLVRSIVHQIHEDGLQQESAEDRSEIYRPPRAIRSEVRDELAEVGYGDEDMAQLEVPSVRSR